jgi:hypothetical protein
MDFEVIDHLFERGTPLPVEEIWGEVVVAPIRMHQLLRNREEGVTFFQTAHATYPDLEDEYLLYLRGAKVGVAIFGYLEDGYWQVKIRRSKLVESVTQDMVNEVLYDVCKAIGFPANVAPNSPHPIKIGTLIRPVP